MHRSFAAGFVCWLLAAGVGSAQTSFSQLVRGVSVQPVKASTPIEIPFITWGGDIATFHANGGLSTKAGSTYNKLGLQIRLTPGDDFVGQVKNYISGKTPFLPG